MRETLSAPAFIGRTIQHLPTKNFRMVRYYGIYARPVRAKVHAQVAEVLAGLAEAQRRDREPGEASRTRIAGAASGGGAESFADGAVRCPQCGREMTLVRIWDERRGVIYDLFEKAGRQSSSALPVESVPANSLSHALVPAQLFLAFVERFAARYWAQLDTRAKMRA